MRYRPLDANGDYTIGVPFLANSPACVAQAIVTRLGLFLGEWFVDVTDGLPWIQQVLSRQFGTDPNTPIKQRILGTPGVTQLLNYSSSITARAISVSGTVDTQYGPVDFSTTVTPSLSTQ